jgi:hypothetical protein
MEDEVPAAAGQRRRRILAGIVFVATLSGFAVNGEFPFALPISLLARDHPHPWCYQAILITLLLFAVNELSSSGSLLSRILHGSIAGMIALLIFIPVQAGEIHDILALCTMLCAGFYGFLRSQSLLASPWRQLAASLFLVTPLLFCGNFLLMGVAEGVLINLTLLMLIWAPDQGGVGACLRILSPERLEELRDGSRGMFWAFACTGLHGLLGAYRDHALLSLVHFALCYGSARWAKSLWYAATAKTLILAASGIGFPFLLLICDGPRIFSFVASFFIGCMLFLYWFSADTFDMLKS